MRVYGLSLGRDNKGLWVELGVIRGLWNNPWCMGFLFPKGFFIFYFLCLCVCVCVYR